MIENLQLCNYEWPTAIQCYTIPAIREGRDVIGIAQTGKQFSSKTVQISIYSHTQVPEKLVPS